MDRVKILIFILLVVLSLVVVALGYHCVQLHNQLSMYIIRATIDFDADTMDEVNGLKTENKPIIVVFGSDYCPTCASYKPYIKELNQDYGDKIVIKYIDTTKHEDIRKEYNIELIPSTIFYYPDGEAYRPKDSIEIESINEVVDELKYVSDTIITVSGDELSLNNSFEYGVDENGELVYCKFIGLLEMLQLEQIAEELLAYTP